MMTKFLTRLLIFIFPAILIIGGIIIIAWDLGYAMPYRFIIQRQQADHRLIYKPATRADRFNYKLQAIEILAPDILLLGSSRVAHFKNTVVDNPDTFYNGFVDNMTAMEANWLIREIDIQSYPEIIILFVDLPSLNKDSYSCPGWRETSDNYPSMLQQIVVGTRDLLHELILKHRSLNTLYEARYNPDRYWSPLGQTQIDLSLLNDSVNNDIPIEYGYDVSGTRTPHIITQQQLDNLRDLSYSWLEEHNWIYSTGIDPEPCPRVIAAIERMINAVEQREKKIIGVALPFTSTAYNALTTEDDLSYFPAVRQHVADLFADYDASYYDFSDPTVLDLDDSLFMDTHHPTPLLSAKVFLEIIHREYDTFAPYVDLDALEAQIENASHPFDFGYGITTK